jgi:hypothetical protein
MRERELDASLRIVSDKTVLDVLRNRMLGLVLDNQLVQSKRKLILNC